MTRTGKLQSGVTTHPLEQLKLKRQTRLRADEDMEGQISHVTGGNKNQDSHFGELFSRHVSHDLATPLLDFF